MVSATDIRFTDHDFISKKLGVPIFFADPYSSWQKGAIENANKLIRQYIPKNTVFPSLDDDFIKAVQFKINDRSRDKLNFLSPKKLFILSLRLFLHLIFEAAYP